MQTLLGQLQANSRFAHALAQLNAREQMALHALQAADGKLPTPQFSADFGTIRAYRPWAEKTQPWKRPQSIAEKLWYLAFIGSDAEHTRLCAEVASVLRPVPDLHPMTPTDTQVNAVNTLLRDLAALLGTLLAHRLTVRDGRRLTPKALRAIERRLRQPDRHVDFARSEWQTGRLRFLHYLAEVGGLVAVIDAALKPSAAAWHWLEQPPPQQWGVLDERIAQDLADSAPLWNTFRLPPLQAGVWQTALALLDPLSDGQLYSTAQFIKALRAQHPAASAESIRNLMNGPLSWSGRISVLPTGKRFMRSASIAMQPTASLLSEQPTMLRIRVADLPHLHPFVEALAWAKAERDTLIVDALTVGRAARQSVSPLHMADTLRRLTETPLSAAAFEQIQRWAKAASQLTLDRQTVLTSSDAALLAGLYGDRRLRRFFVKPLSAHHLVVRPESAHVLEKRLVRRGLLTPTTADLESMAALKPSGSAAYSYLAMRVYQGLADLIELPMPMPDAITDVHKRHLTAEEQDWIEHMVDAIQERLRYAAQGNPRGAAPQVVQSLDLIDVRRAIEHAYAQRSALTIDYFSPAQGFVTRRTIAPFMPIRWEGDVGYIEAWCQLDEAERTFRLDRIIRLVGADDDSPQNG